MSRSQVMNAGVTEIFYDTHLNSSLSYCKTLKSILINIPIKFGGSFRNGGHLKVYVLRSKKSACFSNIGKISSLSNTLVAIKSCIGNWKRSMWVEKKCAYYFSLTTAATRARSCRSSSSAVLPTSCTTSSAHLYAVAQREEGRQRRPASDAPQFDLPIWLIYRDGRLNYLCSLAKSANYQY